jgi:hypothetical protein
MRCRKGTLCNNFILSTSVAVVGTDLVINVPSLPSCGCLTIAQAIPAVATVNMPVVITVGDDTTTTYPLVDCRGIQLSAGQVEPRHPYHYKYIVGNTGSIVKTCNARCPYNVIPV